MEKIIDQNHTKYTYVYSLSKLLERTSYYGIRLFIFLYILDENQAYLKDDKLVLAEWFFASIIISEVIGALLGDLVIGNKRSIILGGILQAVGAFIFCFPNTVGLYIGPALVGLGGGFYSPNLDAHFGKLYLNKTKLLDSAFTILSLAANIGAFIGILLIGYVGEKLGTNIGLIFAGTLMLFSISLPLLSKDVNLNTQLFEKSPNIFKKRLFKILIALSFVALFWLVHNIFEIRVLVLQFKFHDLLDIQTPKLIASSLDSLFFFSFSIIAVILWSYFYSNQFFKLTVGFIFGAFAFGILYFIPETPEHHHFILYLISLMLLSIAKVYLSPIVYSIVTQYANPKYLAIVISLVFLPAKLFYLILGMLNIEC